MKVAGIILVIVVVLAAAAWLKLRGPDIPYETLEAKYADGASYFVDLAGGFRVHYQDTAVAGDKAGGSDGKPADSQLPDLLLLGGFGHQTIEIGHRAVLRIDGLIVRDVVAEVDLRRRIKRSYPDRIHAQRFQIVEMLRDPV